MQQLRSAVNAKGMIVYLRTLHLWSMTRWSPPVEPYEFDGSF